MNEFVLVSGIALITAIPIFLGGVLAEKVDLPRRIVTAALQLAAGIVTGIVAFTLMPPAVQAGPPLIIVLAFFVGGALFVLMERVAAQRQSPPQGTDAPSLSLGFVLGVLVDMAIDGVTIGIGSTLTLATGLLLAFGLGVSAAPLAFVTIATAKQQGVSPDRRRRLSIAFVAAILAGATLGYWALRDQSEQVKLALVALVSGFLITFVTQSMIPEASREAKTNSSALYYVGGLSLFALLTLTVQ